MAEESIRRRLLLRTGAEVLRDADTPLRSAEVMSRIADQLELTPVELSLNDSGVPRFETYVRFGSTWMSSLGWLVKANGTWALTPAGHEALAAFSGDEFDREVTRRYQRLQRERRASADLRADPQTQLLREAVLAVTAGSWTSVEDLVVLSGLRAEEVVRRLDTVVDVPRHRVVPDGTLSAEQRSILASEGVPVGAEGELPTDQQVTAEELRGLVGSSAAGARAWLVRGSAVSGVNVVPQWLAEGFVSIAAAHLTPVAEGTSLEDLQQVVETDYAHLSYHLRKAKLAELHAFLNRMQPGDAVITTSEGLLQVGRIAGEASFGMAGETRTTIRRAVSWQPGRLDFTALPDALQGKLKSSVTVIDLTEVSEIVESLFDVDSAVEQPVAPHRREATVPDLDAETVDRLLVGADWLHEFVDLVRTRRQVILHGPPGTGKTFLALHVAEKLTDPANVALVQFHPAYSYEDFFEGYRPTGVDESGRVGFALTPGPFRKVVDAAKQNPDQAYVLIVDEINRANLAKVFGELYFLLEYRDRAIDLMYSSGDEGRDFTLPPNVYLIGTMNTADRSIALVDAAMRRRFAFLSLHPDDAHMRGVLRGWLAREGMPGEPADLLDELNSRVPDRDFKIGPSYLMRREAGTDVGLDRIWRTSILPLLEEFHYGEAGFDVAARYGLAALRTALPQPPAGSGGPDDEA